MNFSSRIVPFAAIVTVVLGGIVYQTDAAAPGPMVSKPGNKHNLSGTNTTVTYRATNDPVNNPRGQQICIFCHTPHNANVVGQAPLWNRAFSDVQNFQRYTSSTLRIRHIASAKYDTGAQPNGSSKLCLSCHDGTSHLGAVYSGSPIAMVGNDVISGLASFNPSTNKMLSGHHPVSFVFMTGFNSTTQIGSMIPGLPASYRFLPASSAGKVKLYGNRDGNGWMQCTTCHDPHQNQSDEAICYTTGGAVTSCTSADTRKVAPFWVYHGSNTSASQDTGSVCKVCHAFGAVGAPSWP
jgi:hypothetical protein